MKQWKTIVVTAVIALFVVAFALLAFKAFEPQEVRDIKTRISKYRLVREEQQLITDILNLKYEAAVIQAKFKPAPPPPQIKE